MGRARWTRCAAWSATSVTQTSPALTSVIVIEASGVAIASEGLQARIAPYVRDASAR